MTRSKLTSKYQATIPREVREKLKLKKGDVIVFKVVDNNIIMLKKSVPLDKEYLKAISRTLNEWNSAEDEAAYAHLQDI